MAAADPEHVSLFPGTVLLGMIAQVVEGDPTCSCGAPAVLDVVTEPDGEPGLCCIACAEPWLQLIAVLPRKLFSLGTEPEPGPNPI